ncbi:hypothetical protein KP509_06G043700 [Ceratopteris richardii]|uniref:Kinesin motor domain-containing protein n=1 Tax=Ceratopteris richardii TaxID=49495 RepID=A0A8T2UNP8_CERRI|nr:hypothetical protein KP509_06G043700 [Ceratopteris richardii]
METPVSVRRNPPRKAKLNSAEKSSVRECRSTRKRYIEDAKSLMPSFTAADADSKTELPKGDPCNEFFPTIASSASTLQCSSEMSRYDVNHVSKASCNPYTVDVVCTPADIACTYVADILENDLSSQKGNLCPTIVEERENGLRNSAEINQNFQIPGLDSKKTDFENPILNQNNKITSSNMRVFLRIRPAEVQSSKKRALKNQKLSETVNKRLFLGLSTSTETGITSDVSGVCLWPQSDDSVTLSTPAIFSGSHKPKLEDFNGFSYIFNQDSSQREVFDKVLVPRLLDVLRGEDSLVVAMGPTCAGKTYTMLGSPRDPGLIPQSLQYLFSSANSEMAAPTLKIVISMFEIYSEQGGRPEKILDLLQDGAELSLQQQKIKGLHEAVASTIEEANEIYMNGLQKRTTASTAANHQSSRSHCIFNISISEEKKPQSGNNLKHLKKGTLTIADLAGFERERRTKNQGVRLNESSFINNTSMVFGQCLRALLEHQKNPKKTLQRYFQYSMLTRYLKTYMEANGNMTLIVNVSPCEEDYIDTSFVLQQVAPYSKIRFISLPTKDNAPRVKVEKQVPILKKRPQASVKRRKVDGTISRSVNNFDNTNLKILHRTVSELEEPIEGPPKEADPGEIAGVEHSLNESFGASRMPYAAAIPLYTSGDWRDKVISELQRLFTQRDAANFEEISHTIMGIPDFNSEIDHTAMEAEKKLQDQEAEITFLKEKLLSEQDHASSLSVEIECLKVHCAQLEEEILVLKSTMTSKDLINAFPSISASACFTMRKTLEPITNYVEDVVVQSPSNLANRINEISEEHRKANVVEEEDQKQDLGMPDTKVESYVRSPYERNYCGTQNVEESIRMRETNIMKPPQLYSSSEETAMQLDSCGGSRVSQPLGAEDVGDVSAGCIYNPSVTLGYTDKQCEEENGSNECTTLLPTRNFERVHSRNSFERPLQSVSECYEHELDQSHGVEKIISEDLTFPQGSPPHPMVALSDKDASNVPSEVNKGKQSEDVFMLDSGTSSVPSNIEQQCSSQYDQQCSNQNDQRCSNQRDQQIVESPSTEGYDYLTAGERCKLGAVSSENREPERSLREGVPRSNGDKKIKGDDNKENSCSESPMSKEIHKSTAGNRRRRLRPLSSLSFQSAANLGGDLTMIDGKADYAKAYDQTIPLGDQASTLAHLLTKSNK